MKKRYLSVLVIALILIVVVVYYSTFQTPNLNEPQTQGNQTQEDKGFFRFPILFPWQTENETGTTGGSGTGGTTPGGGGSDTAAPRVINNFTLSVNSTHNLEVSIYYTFNDIALNGTKSLPFSLDVQGDTYACLSETTGSGTIRWLINNETDCPYSDCAGGIYGCNLLINENYSIMLRQYS
jgi:hypothetical protein